MAKKIAIITGASGGIGREFTRLLAAEQLDEIWAVARNEEKLDALRQEYGECICPMAVDLAKQQERRKIEQRLAGEKPLVVWLINNAGMARMRACTEFSVGEIEATININCTAVAVLCTMCIPYMQAGSRIVNVSSASAFQPLPYLNLYSATKVFVRNYSRALHEELKGHGITVTAVCPGWVDTELLVHEINGHAVKFPGLISAERVVAQAMRDAERGRDMSVCTLYTKTEHVLAKLFPQRVAMQTWLRRIRRYVES